jgi:hypothetical protein
LKVSRHKNVNLSEVYLIKYIDINMIDTTKWLPIQKENLVYENRFRNCPYLAGVIFLVFGLNGFLNFIPMPPPGGIAGQFMGALYASYYLWVIFAFQVVAAVLLLANRYVPLAVAVLAPVIVNILVFHALMAPSGLHWPSSSLHCGRRSSSTSVRPLPGYSRLAPRRMPEFLNGRRPGGPQISRDFPFQCRSSSPQMSAGPSTPVRTK